jgi:hypothetical protein
MESSLITRVRDPFGAQNLWRACVRESLPPENPPLEGEYIPPECVDSQSQQPSYIFFRLFLEIDVHKSPPTEHEKNELESSYKLSAYRELEKFFGEEKTKGNLINIIV